jgi:hypothetical protein
MKKNTTLKSKAKSAPVQKICLRALLCSPQSLNTRPLELTVLNASFSLFPIARSNRKRVGLLALRLDAKMLTEPEHRRFT